MTRWERLLIALAAFVAVHGAFVLLLGALGRRSDARAFATSLWRTRTGSLPDMRSDRQPVATGSA
jgi:hypothetical protein